MRKLAILLIRIYKYAISPYFASSCGYTPSCSSYAIESIERFGIFKGSWLAICRIGRCHPWGGDGHDPVPENPKKEIN